jgi:hypothetical protein
MEFDYIIICAGSAGWVLANWITSVEVNKVLFLKFEPKKYYASQYITHL